MYLQLLHSVRHYLTPSDKKGPDLTSTTNEAVVQGLELKYSSLVQNKDPLSTDNSAYHLLRNVTNKALS